MKYEIRYLNSEADSRDLKLLCSSPDDAFSADNVVLKDDGTTTLSRITIDIGELVVKRYNTKNFWHFIRRNFQTSRAQNCQIMGEVFAEKGIDVPRSIAVIEHRTGPFQGRSWYICRYVEGVMLLDFMKTGKWEEKFEQVKKPVLDLFRLLAENQLSHGDMKGSNILINNGKLVLIDLDAARKHHSRISHRLAIKKDKFRFLKNWNDNPDLRKKFDLLLLEIGV